MLVSCLITYSATQKRGDKDPEVVRLCSLMAAAGLRGLLDTAFGIEDVGIRVTARERGITTRNLCVKYQATHHKNIGAYTAVVTQQITGMKPQQWKPYLREQFGKGSGGIRDHADELTVNLIEVTEAAMAINDVTLSQAARFAADIRRAAEKNFQYTEPQLSPIKLSARITHEVTNGERAKLTNPHSNRLPLLKEGSND